MPSNNKMPFCAVFAILLLSAPLITSNVSASISKPSIPEFSMKYADYSYDIPPTYGIDQYTGKTVITRHGEHVDNRTIEFKIKNQPFTPQGIYKTLYYNFRYKGPYGNSWSCYPDTSHTYGYYTGTFPDTSASNLDYTIISISIPSLTSYQPGTLGISTGVMIEWQVQAIKGYVNYTPTGMLAGGFCGFAGERSDWSDTQTIIIGEGHAHTHPDSNT
jgi:hypothetical protein